MPGGVRGRGCEAPAYSILSGRARPCCINFNRIFSKWVDLPKQIQYVMRLQFA